MASELKSWIMSRIFSAFRFFLEELVIWKVEQVVPNVNIVLNDEQIKAHGKCQREWKGQNWLKKRMMKILLHIRAFCYRLRHPATGSGILLRIQASCYGFRHPATDSGILLQIQASCYRFRHPATDSGNLLQGHAICYRVMQSATRSCNLIQGHAIWYRVQVEYLVVVENLLQLWNVWGSL